MQKSHSRFIGLDGGGTSTKAVALDGSGNILAEAVSGPSNPNNVRCETAARNISAALRNLGLTEHNSDQTAAVLGIAGLATQEITDSLRDALLAELPFLAQTTLNLTHDLAIAHYAAFHERPGLLIIAGTGSACFAKLPSGEWQKASGRGETFDDPGSGFAIAQNAIDLRLLQPPEALDRSSIAALAPRVFALAERSNPVAKGILATEAQQLLELATPLANAFPETLQVSFSGSIFTESNLFREIFLESLENSFPKLELIEQRQASHFAAAEMAQKLDS